MKKNVLVLLVFFFLTILSFIFPSTSVAHVLETDGTVGAVLHIDPEDDPIPQKESRFFFDLKDTTNRLTTENCDCSVTIMQAGKEIHREQLFQNIDSPELDDAVFAFTFPRKDIYTITLLGKPTTPNAFQPFQLTYTVRVTRNSSNNASVGTDNTANFHLFHGFLVLVGFAVAVYIVRKDKRKEVHD